MILNMIHNRLNKNCYELLPVPVFTPDLKMASNLRWTKGLFDQVMNTFFKSKALELLNDNKHETAMYS